MSFLSKLEYYLSEKGRFDSFPIHMLGYPLLIVFFAMGICFDVMGLSDSTGAPALRIIGLIGLVLALVCLFLFKGSRPRPSVGIFTILLVYAAVILICAIPYVYYGFPVQAALFESVSGITTTGLSVMHLSELSDALLLWRAITGWIGGFLFIAVFCLYTGAFGLPGRYAFSSGSTSVDSEVYKLQVNKVAVRYSEIYAISTVLLTLLLVATGTEGMAALRLAMSTVSTTGFMDMHGGLDVLTPASRAVIGLFMLIAMLNFMSLFYTIVKRTAKPFKEDNENLYLFVWLLIIGVVAFILLAEHDLVPEDAEGYLDFILVLLSTASTTGFMISDYSWPAGLVLVFSLGSVVGGSIDSPTGGVKVARAAMALKLMKNEVTEVSFPNQVNALRVRRVNVGPSLAYGSLLTMLMFFVVLIAGTILISLTEIDMESALYLATSAITTTGKGLYSIGELTDLGQFTQTVCAVLMIIGRLEVVLIAVLFTPGFWRDLLSRISLRQIITGRRQVS